MCLGRHTLRRVAESAHPDHAPDHPRRHGLETASNFFERSAWAPQGLAYRVGVLIVTRRTRWGASALRVDDTSTHKRGRHVWGLGWFRDAVASTPKRVATAGGHNWVVRAVAVCRPGTAAPVLALPLSARLRRPGKGQPSCPQLARAMLGEVLAWWPGRRFTLVGDGGYANKGLLADLGGRVTFVGRLRGDAAVDDPRVPVRKEGRRGRKAKKGPRLPRPKEAAARADRKRAPNGDWVWQEVAVSVYGCARSLKALADEAVWPTALGSRAIQVVVGRDPSGRMRDCYLFTTDVRANVSGVITRFAWRWAIEGLFRASKQVMDIGAPRPWSREAVEEVAPWVWSMQSVIRVWDITAGYESAEAAGVRGRMGEWDSEWSLRHMLQVLRRVIRNATMDPNSADQAQLVEMVQALKNWANLAA
jgi:hypothetical protein